MEKICYSDHPDYLILFPYMNDWTYKKMIENGIEVKNVYRKCNLFQTMIRKAFIKFQLPFFSIWYDSWKKNLNDYETVIIFDTAINKRMIEYIRTKMTKKIKIVAWYWNPASHSIHPDAIPNDLFEKWSFDEEDCKKYNMKYNSAFYFKNVGMISAPLEYDIFFIGKDKGRLSQLLELEQRFRDLNLKTNFHIVRNKPYLQRKNFVLKDAISYEEVLKNIAKSSAILEILQDNQAGPSLRAMESIFFSKKLITNNQYISHFDFYHKNNIFILGQDDMNELPHFLSAPYESIDDDLIEKYDINRWLERFSII